jgi:hypothetical protein
MCLYSPKPLLVYLDGTIIERRPAKYLKFYLAKYFLPRIFTKEDYCYYRKIECECMRHLICQ